MGEYARSTLGLGADRRKPLTFYEESKMKAFVRCVLIGIALVGLPVLAQSATDSKTEILLQKIKADKKFLVASNMGLTDDEGKKFWPLYDEYQKELEQVNQSIGKTIQEYADAFNKGPVPNDQAKKLMNDVLAIEDKEGNLKRHYADKIGQVLPAAKTARYIQIETKIRALVKAELAKEIPLVY